MAREKAIGQAQRQATRRRTRKAGGRDMLISLAVLLVPILLIVALFQRAPARPPVEAIDPVAAAVQAQPKASFPLLVATGLPRAWVPIEAAWTPLGGQLLGHGVAEAGTWVVGYQTPDDTFVSISQQAGKLPTFVEEFTHSAAPDGTSTVAGQQWTRYAGTDGSTRYLVRVTSADTIIIEGAEPYGALETFVTTLTSSH